MRKVNVQEAKTHLSKLLAEVEQGGQVIIARSGRPIARLVAVTSETRTLGMDEGRIRIAEDFDAPLPDDVLDAFEGR